MMSETQNIFATATMPDGRPAPSVLTEEEAVRFLRLDRQKADPTKTLKYYREQKLLKATKLGKNLLYSRQELEQFIVRLTN